MCAIAIPVTVPRSGNRTFSSLPSRLARYTPPNKSVMNMDRFFTSSSRPIPSWSFRTSISYFVFSPFFGIFDRLTVFPKGTLEYVSHGSVKVLYALTLRDQSNIASPLGDPETDQWARGGGQTRPRYSLQQYQLHR
jgi:hypothetical protein